MNQKKNQTGRIVLIVLTVILTAALLLMIGAARVSYMDMKRESPQWVDRAIQGYYSILQLTIVIAGLCTAAWTTLFLKRRPPSLSGDPQQRQKLRTVFIILTVLCFVLCGIFIFRTRTALRNLQWAETSKDVDVLSPFVRACGRNEVICLVFLVSGLFSLAGIFLTRRKDPPEP